MGALMFQGTGSDVGKSVLVAGLCRALTNRGLVVRPFKPQNMSNNAAVTADGGEIGRAQALQALACRTVPTTDMNPVLLKPQGDRSSQLVVHGKVRGVLRASRWREGRAGLLDDVLASYWRLRAEADLVVVEGAGSPAEINLRSVDIANMGFARAAGVPVVLIGDIDRGGVIASLVGTHAVIDPEDRAMIAGFVINKFRGDPALFGDGYRAVEHMTGWRGLGIAPWLPQAARLPAEDAVALERHGEPGDGRVVIACPVLPRIANFDDLDPLKLEPEVALVMVRPGEPLPGNAALVILPGSKTTIADLAAFRANGWDIDLLAHYRRGGHILGLCGGYQMLGKRIADPHGIEGPAGAVDGLGLLDIETVLAPEKTLREVRGWAADSGAPFAGYEMHLGATEGADRVRPLVCFEDGRTDGAVSRDGRVAGTYVHGLLADPEQRRARLGLLGARGSGRDYGHEVDAALDGIAQVLEASLDIDAMIDLSRRSNERQ